jgi:hypothetical protein
MEEALELAIDVEGEFPLFFLFFDKGFEGGLTSEVWEGDLEF